MPVLLAPDTGADDPEPEHAERMHAHVMPIIRTALEMRSDEIGLQRQPGITLMSIDRKPGSTWTK